MVLFTFPDGRSGSNMEQVWDAVPWKMTESGCRSPAEFGAFWSPQLRPTPLSPSEPEVIGDFALKKNWMDQNGRFCASVWVWSGNRSLRVMWNNGFTVRISLNVTCGALKQAEQRQTKPMKAKWKPRGKNWNVHVSLTISMLTAQVIVREAAILCLGPTHSSRLTSLWRSCPRIWRSRRRCSKLELGCQGPSCCPHHWSWAEEQSQRGLKQSSDLESRMAVFHLRFPKLFQIPLVAKPNPESYKEGSAGKYRYSWAKLTQHKATDCISQLHH